MHFLTLSIRPAILLAYIASHALAAPVPQLAGFGAACNSILSSTDNGVGYGVENAEDNTANLITSVKGAPLPPAAGAGAGGVKRQLAGEGAACDSILSQTDNGAGYGVKNAEENTANLVAPVGQAAGGAHPPAPKKARQLDKIADGAGALGGALGAGAVTAPANAELDTLDGQSTGDAALLGQQVGDDEATTLENAGSLVP